MRIGSTLSCLALTGLLLPAPRNGADLVAALQKNLNGLRDLQARFTQRFHSENLGPTPVEEGIVYVKFPGRMRWEYSDPAGKLAVLDGENTFLYLPEDHLAYQGSWEDLRQEGAAVLFLTGKMDIHREFLVERVPDGPEVPSGIIRLQLIPRNPDSRFDAYYLDLSRDGTRIRGVLMDDPLGNRVEYRFRNIRENPGLPEDLFRFEPPPGTEIQRMGSADRPPTENP